MRVVYIFSWPDADRLEVYSSAQKAFEQVKIAADDLQITLEGTAAGLRQGNTAAAADDQFVASARQVTVR